MLLNVIDMQYVRMLGIAVAFLLTFICTKTFKKYLPLDQGKALAVDSMKSAGKPEGAGIIFVIVFIVCGLLFNKLSIENSINLGIIAICMLTGYLDDCAKIPWHEYFKGALDLVVAIMVAVTYIYYNGTDITLRLIECNVNFNPILLGFIIVCLVWCSINVTNCSDGVDGLSASLTISTLSAFYLTANNGMKEAGYDYFILIFIVCILAYLWFNANPSILLMGDAGSRAMGIFIAMVAMKSGDLFLYFIFAIMLIIDGGLGLVKVALKRFLKISILVNTRTPIHDHFKNVWGRDKLVWIVFRFVIIQVAINLAVIQLLM